MKPVFVIISVFLFSSCKLSKESLSNYYFVEPFKEQEIKLFFNKDSAFSFRDVSGCNQFEFAGKFRKLSNQKGNYFVFDSITLIKVLSNTTSNLMYTLSTGDTAWILNSERLFIHNQPFKLMTNSQIDLQKIRYTELKTFYINVLGKTGFIKTFGLGKGEKEAKKRLLECTLPDLNFK